MACIHGYSDDAFNHFMILTRGNWFQTNPVEYVSNDHTDRLCFISGKNMAHSRQIRSVFVAVLCFCITEIKDRAGILVLVRVL